MKEKEAKCRITGRKASAVPEYIVGAEDYQTTPDRFVKKYDSTYDEKTNTFVSPELVDVYYNTVLLRG